MRKLFAIILLATVCLATTTQPFVISPCGDKENHRCIEPLLPAKLVFTQETGSIVDNHTILQCSAYMREMGKDLDTGEKVLQLALHCDHHVDLLIQGVQFADPEAH